MYYLQKESSDKWKVFLKVCQYMPSDKRLSYDLNNTLMHSRVQTIERDASMGLIFRKMHEIMKLNATSAAMDKNNCQMHECKSISLCRISRVHKGKKILLRK